MKTIRARCTLHAACVLLLALLPVAGTPSHADEPPPFLLQWGSSGSGDGQFLLGTGIALSNTGVVYVSDGFADRVQRFTLSGTFISKWGTTGSGPGQFDGPLDVAVDIHGNVYVSDSGNPRIQKFGADGFFIREWGPLIGRLAADPVHEFIYVVNFNEVHKFTLDGVFVRKFGQQMETDFGGLAVAEDGRVYVAVEKFHQVLKYRSDGVLEAVWGNVPPTSGEGDNEFRKPSDVAVGPDGSVYVVDRNAVRKFSPSGTFLARWGRQGSAPGEFQDPTGISVDDDGNVYVMDSGNDRVQKFGEVPTSPVNTTWGRLKALYR